MSVFTDDRLVDIIDEIMNERSKLLFDKPYQMLSLQELDKLNQYNHDLAYPIWKPVVVDTIETNYEVSNTGVLRNHRTGNVINPYINHKGYPAVILYITKTKRLNTFIHRLVAIAFIPNPENKPQVNHINGKKTLNWVGNLEWNTQTENINHAINTGLMRVPGKGIDARHCEHNEEEVHSVCKLLEKGIPIRKICETLNVKPSFVMGIKYQGNWKDIRSNYNIPESNTYGDRTNKQKLIVEKLIMDGVRNRREIIRAASLLYNTTSISFIKYKIREYNRKVKGSTTIKHSSDGGNTSELVLVTP